MIPHEDSPGQRLPLTVEVPTDLCNQCGKCCQSATTGMSHTRLTALAAQGNDSAKRFLEVFIPFESLEAARAVVPEQVDRVAQLYEERPEYDLADLVFYHCRHLQADNRCGIYEDRPIFCREAPRNGWMVMPHGCGFEGWQFEQQEADKQAIRQLKETLYMLECLSPDGEQHPLRPEESLQPLRLLIAEKVKTWERFGAKDW